MRGIRRLSIVAFLVFGLLPLRSVFAQKSSTQVPITYPGDTEKTITRRAQWIEGAKKEGRLVWWGTVAPKEKMAIMAEFIKIYPFIKLEAWRGGPQETASKLEADWNAKHFSCDVSQGGSYNLARWREMGMIQKFVDIIPGIEKWDKRAYSPFGDSASPGDNVDAPQYNTKLVSAAEAPKSWEDVLDPKWKAQIGISSEMKYWWTLALDGGWGIEKTEAYLRRLAKQNLIWAADNSLVHSLLIAGEVKIAATGFIRHVMLSQQKGAPVEWARVKPFLVFPGDVYLPQRGPNPNATRLFIEWLFSPQGLAVHEEVTGKGSVVSTTGSKISKAVAGLPLAYETDEVLAKAIGLGLNERFFELLGVQR